MASFDIIGILDTRVTVDISGVTAGDTVRVFVRRTDETTAVFDKAYTAPSKSFSVSVTGLEPGTEYTANVAVNSSWIGAEGFETEAAEIERPDDWEWWTDKEQDEEIYIEAEEWNAFTECINAFRLYDGDLDEYDFTSVSKGDKISHSIINEAREAIKPITGHGTLPDEVYEEDPLEASIFNKLRKALNAVE